MTQEMLAEALHISPMTLQFIEQGRRFPSLPMLFYVLEFLEIEVEFILPNMPALKAAEASPSSPRRGR